MPPPRIVRVAVGGVERSTREAFAARFAVLREEIGAQAIAQMSKGRLLFARIEGHRRPLGPANKVTDIRRQHCELRMMAGTVVQEPVQAVTSTLEDVLELAGCSLARRRGCEISRTALQKAPERVWCHQPPIQ